MKCPFSNDFFKEAISDILNFYNSSLGIVKKLLILDLDDTLWGGIVGFIVFITLSFQPDSHIEPAIVYGLTGLGVAIMLHSIYFHKRHKEYFSDQERQRKNLDATITQDRLS